MLFDTHAHLNDEQYNDDLNDVLSRAINSGVSKILIAGYDMPSSLKALDIAKGKDYLYASVGIHPHDADKFDESAKKELSNLIKTNKKKVVAVGEIGLDFHYDFSPRKLQVQAFEAQLELAKEFELPVIIHDRKAHDDCLKIVSDFKKEGKLSETPGVFHCFSGDVNLAKKLIEIGFYISLAGPVTFKNARHSVEVVKNIPLDRILIETDCPYLAPVPYRGKRNEPSYVENVADKIAQILSISKETVQEQTYKNACKLFDIKQ